MMRSENLLLCCLLLTIFIFGCSGGSVSITPPPQEPSGPPSNGDNGPALQSYLGDGHPIEGVNYRRNNRSPYTLQISLQNGESIENLFESDYGLTTLSLHTFVIDETERLYVGRYYNYQTGGLFAVSDKHYELFSFYFGDEHGSEYQGGMEIILTDNGVYTIGHASDSYDADMTQDYGSSSRSDITHYSPWPIVASYVSSERGTQKGIVLPNFYGEWGKNGRIFAKLLPLPDGTLIASYTRPLKLGDNHERAYFQRLDADMQVLADAETSVINPIIDFAYNEELNCIYLTREGSESYGNNYVSCHNTYLEELWNTRIIWRYFSAYMPVIDDEDGVLGVKKGFLRRVDGAGRPIAITACQARSRPALFNDGTIVVICESGILYFDTDLNETGAIPLPTGPGTGSGYTRPPLVDANDNFAIFHGPDLWIIHRLGAVLAHRTCKSDIRQIRLGPEHLFVALDNAIYRFPA